MEGADELTAVLELKSLARYGNRLNSQLKRPT
jgi:hypothetical protein